MSAVAALVASWVLLISLPAAIYQSATWIWQMLPEGLLHRATPMPTLGNFIGLCFLLVAIAGRPMCAVTIILDLVLLFSRGAPIWLKLLASVFVVLAILGTLLVEAQARHVRN